MIIFLIGNLHKWYFAPRGCGFLWVSPAFTETINPSIVSHTYKGDLQHRFYKQGTDDYSNFLAAGYSVSQYYPSIGGMVGAYIESLMHWTGRTTMPCIRYTFSPYFFALSEGVSYTL